VSGRTLAAPSWTELSLNPARNERIVHLPDKAAGTPHSRFIKHYQGFSGVARGLGFFARPHQG